MQLGILAIGLGERSTLAGRLLLNMVFALLGYWAVVR